MAETEYDYLSGIVHEPRKYYSTAEALDAALGTIIEGADPEKVAVFIDIQSGSHLVGRDPRQSEMGVPTFLHELRADEVILSYQLPGQEPVVFLLRPSEGQPFQHTTIGTMYPWEASGYHEFVQKPTEEDPNPPRFAIMAPPANLRQGTV